MDEEHFEKQFKGLKEDKATGHKITLHQKS